MAGYNYELGMSNNAVAAYSKDLVPLSKLKIDDLRAVDLKISLAFAKWLAKSGHWPSSEWHHSGGTWYNKVDFYDVGILAQMIENGSIDILRTQAEYDEERINSKIEAAQDQEKGKPVKGHFAEWGGSRRSPRIIGHIEFTGRLINGWIHIDGVGKKKASGNHIHWEYVVSKDEMEPDLNPDSKNTCMDQAPDLTTTGKSLTGFQAVQSLFATHSIQ